jgi:two-component system CheB/CheR fusion protein
MPTMPDNLTRQTLAELTRELELLRRAAAETEHELRTYREEISLQTEQLLAAQSELEISRDRYADLYDFAPLPYVTLTTSGIVDDLNLTGASLLECDRKTVVGLPFAQFVAADNRRAFLDHLRNCRQGCSPWSTELQVQSRSGRGLPVQLLTVRALDPQTGDLQFRTVLVDLAGRKAAEAEVRLLNADLEARVRERTHELEQANAALELEVQERRSAEQALRASEERFRHLADAIPHIVWISDNDGRLEYLNRRWFELTGLSFDESCEPGSWRRVIHPNDAPPLEKAWQMARSSGDPLEIQYRLLDHASGKYVWHLGLAVPVRSDQTIVRWFGTSTDISSHKQYEHAMQETSRRKDEFLAMLGHELRNPLAACAGAVAMLQFEDTASREIIQARQIIARQLDTMTRMVDDLLDVSRVVRGKIALRRKPVDLAEIVRRAASVVETLLHARKQLLNISVPDRPVIADVDATRIEQVLINLLSNAAKYTPCGGQIELRLEHDSVTARLIVRDNGDGLAPELIEHVFDIFVQGERSADRAQGGLGIGLTMAKSLIELHGGTIDVHSAGPGQGSQFVVTLPCPASPPGAALKSEPGFTDALPGAMANSHVLVVEDNQDVAKTLVLLLERLGLTCHVVYDGPAALSAIEKLHPDVVLMDIGLPGMDGYEVARRVRQLQVHQPRLIALTGYGLPENVRLGAEAGFDHYLTKPVMPSTLYALVRGQHVPAG